MGLSSVLLIVFALVLCLFIYSMATYALPIAIGWLAGHWAFETGAGELGAGVVGIITGGLVFGLVQSAFARNPSLRWLIILIFAGPAAFAGYTLVMQFSQSSIPSPVWRQILSLIAGAFSGGSAIARLKESRAPSRPTL